MNNLVQEHAGQLQRSEDLQKDIASLLITPLLDDLDKAYQELQSKDLQSIDQLYQALSLFANKTSEINQQVAYVTSVLTYLSQN